MKRKEDATLKGKNTSCGFQVPTELFAFLKLMYGRPKPNFYSEFHFLDVKGVTWFMRNYEPETELRPDDCSLPVGDIYFTMFKECVFFQSTYTRGLCPQTTISDNIKLILLHSRCCWFKSFGLSSPSQVSRRCRNI
jgi:hypothetical protein